MPDSSTSASPGGDSTSSSPGTGGGKSRKSSGSLPNQAILDELLKAENLCLKAQKLENAAKLSERDITGAFLSATLVKIQLARAESARATDLTTDKEGLTGDEQRKKTALLVCLTEIQKAAKQKFRTQPDRLGDYYVGERIDQNRARLEQLGGQMIAKAATEALPGIKPSKITAANEALAAYKASEGTQTGAQSGATGSRGTLATMMKEITNARITIQLAADTEWPHQNTENAAIRREFQLPTNRAVKG